MKDFDDAVAAYRSGHFAAAVEGFRRVSSEFPANPRPLHNLSLALRELGRFEEAEDAIQAATQLRPDFAPYWNSLANLLRLLGRLNAAEAAYGRALALTPTDSDARLGMAYTLLGQGRYADGWPLLEARRGAGGTPAAAPGVEWTGDDLAGKRLLIWREQGLGDMIMMARYLPLLRDMGAELVFACHDELRRLIDGMGVAGRPSEFDVSALAFSLPRLLRTELAAIPPPARFRISTGRGRGRGRIGVAWRVQARGWNAANKALPEPLGRELLSIPGAISLHPQDTGARDMQDTADLISGLELVIAVDTSVAHLAGSLGKPTWILLPAYGADWRWLQAREDSPWYPSARLFRQRAPGEWADLVADVRRLAS